ncbi:MAG: DUF1801 domain-containing protein [Pseudomonadota bacterium]
MKSDKISDSEVAKVFAAYPPSSRSALLALRALILETAEETAGVGPLDETLKWGQPSYLTAETKAGTTVRIDRVKGSADQIAVYVHCQSGLIDQFRDRYDGELSFEGKRAIMLSAGEPLPEEPLRHCIALALTHHLRKKKTKR